MYCVRVSDLTHRAKRKRRARCAAAYQLSVLLPPSARAAQARTHALGDNARARERDATYITLHGRAKCDRILAFYDGELVALRHGVCGDLGDTQHNNKIHGARLSAHAIWRTAGRRWLWRP